MPARFSDIVRVLAAFGVDVEKPSGGGSHWKAKRAGCRPYTIPAHNLKAEISDIYLRALCRALELDFKEFKKRL